MERFIGSSFHLRIRVEQPAPPFSTVAWSKVGGRAALAAALFAGRHHRRGAALTSSLPVRNLSSRICSPYAHRSRRLQGDRSPPQFKLLAKDALGEKCQASMAVSEKPLFIRSDKNLFFLRASAR